MTAHSLLYALLPSLCLSELGSAASASGSTAACNADDDAVSMAKVMSSLRLASTDVPGGAARRLARPAQKEEVEGATSNAGDGALLRVGTFVQALPGSELLDSDQVQYYSAGDRGRVSGFLSGSEKRILVTWERTGLTSSVTHDGWRQILRVIGELPELHEGDWLQALPNQKAQDKDGLIYEPGEFGVVVEVLSGESGEVATAEGLRMVSVMWSKSQRVSTISSTKWPKYFRYARIEGPSKAREGLNTDSALEVGAQVQVKHVKVYAQCGDYCGEEFFNSTDLGRISGFMTKSQQRILVTWERTGKTSALPRKYWSRFIRIIAKAPELKLGDWLQALPNQSSVDNATGEVIFQPLDFGRVVEANPSNVTISWSHTQKNSTALRQRWPRELRLAKPADLPASG